MTKQIQLLNVYKQNGFLGLYNQSYLVKKIHSSNSTEDDYWALERDSSHQDGREIESNHSESGGSD